MSISLEFVWLELTLLYHVLINFQTQQNIGNNAAAQQGGSGSGGSGKGGGNSIDQGIGQSQSSGQNSIM